MGVERIKRNHEQDESHFDALARMFEQALKIAMTLPAEARTVRLSRLNTVCQVSRNFGYGVGDDMDDLLAGYGVDA